MHNIIVSDLDGTLTVEDKLRSYPDREADLKVVRAADAARTMGFQLIIATARNMRTYQGDIEKINANTLPGVKDWLARKGVTHDGIVVGKTWCGPRGFYVDDRNLHIEEFVARFTGAYSVHSIAVISLIGDTTPDALSQIHYRNRRLERWLHVQRYRYLACSVYETPLTIRDDPYASITHASPWPGDRDALLAAVSESSEDFVLLCDCRDADPMPSQFFSLYAEHLATLGPRELVAAEPMRYSTTSISSTSMVLAQRKHLSHWLETSTSNMSGLTSLALAATRNGAVTLPVAPQPDPEFGRDIRRTA